MKLITLILFLLICIYSILVFFEGLERYYSQANGTRIIQATGDDYSSGHGYYQRRIK